MTKNSDGFDPSTGFFDSAQYKSGQAKLTNRDLNWLANYNALKAYIAEHHHLPDKHRVECRALLNWAKYQRKRIKDGSLDEEKTRLFNELMESRSNEHTGGGRRPPN